MVTEADSLRDGVVAFDLTLTPTDQNNWIYSLRYEFYDHEITKSGIDLMKTQQGGIKCPHPFIT